MTSEAPNAPRDQEFRREMFTYETAEFKRLIAAFNREAGL
jgi:hypothetical protein